MAALTTAAAGMTWRSSSPATSAAEACPVGLPVPVVVVGAVPVARRRPARLIVRSASGVVKVEPAVVVPAGAVAMAAEVWSAGDRRIVRGAAPASRVVVGRIVVLVHRVAAAAGEVVAETVVAEMAVGAETRPVLGRRMFRGDPASAAFPVRLGGVSAETCSTAARRIVVVVHRVAVAAGGVAAETVVAEMAVCAETRPVLGRRMFRGDPASAAFPVRLGGVSAET